MQLCSQPINYKVNRAVFFHTFKHFKECKQREYVLVIIGYQISLINENV